MTIVMDAFVGQVSRSGVTRRVRSPLVLGWLPMALVAQQPEGVPPDAGIGPKIDAMFHAYGNTTPGAVVAVIRAGDIVFSNAYGMADLERNVPLTTSSVFNIASIAKQFTAMCVALLVERSKLGLADDVHKYLPEMRDYGHAITVSHLLHHTSGLMDYGQIIQRGDAAVFDSMNRDRVLPLVFRQSRLNFVPGDEFDYSDTNYVLLAVLVERISGQSFAAFARQEVFEPLGMTQSHFCDDVTRIIPNRALGYTRSGKGWQIGDSYSQVGGEGDMFTTVGDLAKWDRNSYEPKVGGTAAQAIMLGTEPLNDGFPNSYAAGLKILTVHGLRAVEHSGGETGYDVDMIRFPDQRLTVVVLTNDRDDSRPKTFVQRIAALYLAGKALPAAPPPGSSVPQPFKTDPKDLEQLAGLYWDGRTDAVRRVAVRNGEVANAKLPSADLTPMTAVGPDHFARGVVDYTFTRDPATMTRGTPGMRPVVYHRVEPAAADPGSFGRFAGTYFCEDADLTYRLGFQDGHLLLQRRGRADEQLVPAFRDAFFGDPGLLVFTHPAEGRAGLEVMGERLRKLVFARQ